MAVRIYELRMMQLDEVDFLPGEITQMFTSGVVAWLKIGGTKNCN